jgi:polysaccharide biosynthesis/export protein
MTRFLQLCIDTSRVGVPKATATVILFCVALSVMSSLGGGQAGAQQDQGSSLRTLLDALEGLSDVGGSEIGRSVSPLGRSRDAAAEAAGERAEARVANRTILSLEEAALFGESCRSVDKDDEVSRLLDVVVQVSRLERDYCSRIRQPILQVGYDLFEGVFAEQVLATGAARDDFVLGIGDELIITFVGGTITSQTATVDREGRVTTSKLPPVAAASRTLGEFRQELQTLTKAAFIGTEVFVSLGAIRQVSVMVVGEVPIPGFHQLTALSSVFEAIGIAGGVKKTGSLRRVELHRGGRVIPFDLYDIIFGGNQGRGTFGGNQERDLSLREGDRIVVGSVGPTFAVVGDVNRSGIFELDPDQDATSIRDSTLFAGGTLRPRGNTYVVVSFDENGRELVREISPDETVSDGDIVLVSRSRDAAIGAVELSGHVRVPGKRALSRVTTVKGLLGEDSVFSEEPYLLFGVLESVDPISRVRQYFGLNLQLVVDGQEDFSLRDGDRLLVLGIDDIRYLSSKSVQDVIADPAASGGQQTQDEQERLENVGTGGQSPTLDSIQQITQSISSVPRRDETERDQVVGAQRSIGAVSGRQECRSLDRLGKLVSEARRGRFGNSRVWRERPTEAGGADRVCRSVFEDNVGLLPFVLEHAVVLAGEVRHPGAYPVAEGVSLALLVGSSGGLTRRVDLQRTELVSQVVDGAGAPLSPELVALQRSDLNRVLVEPGDFLRFNPLGTDRDDGPIFLTGEFARPGAYAIRRGERLSSVIARAGGLTAEAYPFGAVFTRESVRRSERVALDRLSRELNSALISAAATEQIETGALNTFSGLSRQIADAPATGRVVIEADPAVLQVRPELDVVLQPGDRVIMPKRPSSVLVTGDVLSPGAKQFVAGRTVDVYLEQAGGFQRSADRNRVFVVFPNGAAKPISVSPFSYSSVRVPPGSTIVVPKDATPFGLLAFARDVSQVLSQLAITAASLAVISNN